MTNRNGTQGGFALPDASARAHVLRADGGTLGLVGPSGSGKTGLLVERVLRALAQGGSFTQLVLVTATPAAADAVRTRLAAAIDAALDGADQEPVRCLWRRARQQLETAYLGAPDTLAARWLASSTPAEPGALPLRGLDADEARELYDQVFERWFVHRLTEPGPAVIRVMRGVAGKHQKSSTPRERLHAAGWALLDAREHTAAWRRPTFAREALFDELFSRSEQLTQGRAAHVDTNDYFAMSLDYIGQWVDRVRGLEAVGGGRDYDTLELVVRESFDHWQASRWSWSRATRSSYAGLKRAEALQVRDALREDWREALTLSEARLAAELREELRPLVDGYRQALHQRGAVDGPEALLLLTARLQEQPSLRSVLQARHTTWLVDDVDAMEPRARGLLELLCDGVSSAVVVSREEPPDLAADRSEPSEEPRWWLRLPHTARLTVNVRSVRSLVSFQEAAFGAGRVSDTHPSAALHDDPAGQATVVALPVPRPYSERARQPKVSTWAIEQSYPQAVAAWLAWLLRDSGWTVTENGRSTPIVARHVALIARGVTTPRARELVPYARALAARGIASRRHGDRGFLAGEEVTALLDVLDAIERPDDELLRYAVLRGPFFALSDEALLIHRHRHGGLVLPDAHEDQGAVGECLRFLDEMHAARNARPLSTTLEVLLARSRALAGFALWVHGEAAPTGILQVLEWAHRQDRQRAPSFRSFVHSLRASCWSPAPTHEGVHLLGADQTHGLEFAVVVLIDPCAPAHDERHARVLDAAAAKMAMPLAGCAPLEVRHAAESVRRQGAAAGLRALGRAVSCAAQLLVVPVIGDPVPVEQYDGWTMPLAPAVYPPSSRWRGGQARPFVPRLGEDCVLDRPAGFRPTTSMRPGAVQPARGEHEVVFWDPAVLEARGGEGGLQRPSLLAASEPDSESPAVPTWREVHRARQSRA